MRFLIDADSFPSACRDVICRASARHGAPVVFVARQAMRVPKSPLASFVLAPDGPDGADDWLVANAAAADLVFTRDIPLAARLVAKGVAVLNDRGTVYTKDNIGPRLGQRDLMADLRELGVAGMGGAAYGPRELREFANAFDRELARRRRPEA